jgi:hypothetical protein
VGAENPPALAGGMNATIDNVEIFTNKITFCKSTIYLLV